MKIFKSILLILINLLTLPLNAIATTGIMWYTLPNLKYCIIGNYILKILSPTTIFWVTIASIATCILLYILQIIFNRYLNSKTKNLFIHLNTWIIALVASGLSIATFTLINPLVGEQIVFTIPRKISIGAILVILILFHLLSKKLSIIINRRIQAYETAKESNLEGRGSIVFTNLLKLFEVFFPEMLILALICCCVNWSISSYFIVVLVAALIPIIGNIVCDFNARYEVIHKKQLEHQKLVEDVANKIKEK